MCQLARSFDEKIAISIIEAKKAKEKRKVALFPGIANRSVSTLL
jgi:hypothetical protein